MKPSHHLAHGFPIHERCLQVGGMPLPLLAERVGQTPFYAYERRLITQRVRELRAALPRTVHLHYSLKANPMPALAHYLAGLVDGCDVASAGELQVALDAGWPAAAISFAGPGKSDAELARAIAAGVILTLESQAEAERAARIGASLQTPARVMLRINPAFEMKGSGMRMGGGAKPFGVDAEQAPQVLRRIGELGLDFHGLHIFSGSQCLNSAAIIQAQALTFQLALELARHAPGPLRMLNIGGGFGIPYFPGDLPLDLAAVGAALKEEVERFLEQVPGAAGTEIVLELGRYLVGEAGVYVTRVVDRKISRGQVFLVTDGGMHHHLSASGNLGQVIRKNYPVIVGNKADAQDTEVASVVGPLCTPLDVLADRLPLARAEPGDLIVVFQSGAYGLSASPVGFLSRALPVEVLV